MKPYHICYVPEGTVPEHHLFDERALQEYLLICCQTPSGGLLDKPGKKKDIFHTCYTLSGLSVAQHFLTQKRVLGQMRNEVVSKFLWNGVAHFHHHQ